MSIEAIDRYIAELDVVKNHSRLVEERDQAVAKSGRLEKELSIANERIEHLEQLPSQFEGKTFRQAEEEFLRAQENEIQKRAIEIFTGNKGEWERQEKPKEVTAQAVSLLKHVVQVLNSKSRAKYFSSELAEAEIPEAISGLLEEQVQGKIDEEFKRRVEIESTKKAKDKLEHLTAEEWPKFLEPKVKQLQGAITTNVFRVLRGPWYPSCDKCSQRLQQGIELSTSEINSLIAGTMFEVTCPNPDCKDFFGRHQIKFSLLDLIEYATST